MWCSKDERSRQKSWEGGKARGQAGGTRLCEALRHFCFVQGVTVTDWAWGVVVAASSRSSSSQCRISGPPRATD